MEPDSDLVRNMRNGSVRAFAELYGRYKLPLYRFSLKLVGDGDIAQDVVQTVFLKMHDHRDELIHADRFKTWMFAIARNHCFSHLRTARRTVGLNDALEEPAEEGIDARMLEQEKTELVRNAIGRLGAEDREVVLLREYEGLSCKEIADVTGTTEAAVKSRLFKVRRRLFDMLKPMFQERS